MDGNGSAIITGDVKSGAMIYAANALDSVNGYRVKGAQVISPDSRIQAWTGEFTGNLNANAIVANQGYWTGGTQNGQSNGPSSGKNVIDNLGNSNGGYWVKGVQVIDGSRNIINVGNMNAGEIVASGNINAGAGIGSKNGGYWVNGVQVIDGNRNANLSGNVTANAFSPKDGYYINNFSRRVIDSNANSGFANVGVDHDVNLGGNVNAGGNVVASNAVVVGKDGYYMNGTRFYGPNGASIRSRGQNEYIQGLAGWTINTTSNRDDPRAQWDLNAV